MSGLKLNELELDYMLYGEHFELFEPNWNAKFECIPYSEVVSACAEVGLDPPLYHTALGKWFKVIHLDVSRSEMIRYFCHFF